MSLRNGLITISSLITTITKNNKALSADISLSASDVGADATGSAAGVQTNLNSHTGSSAIHVTSTDKTTWNGKQASITATGILKGNGSGSVSAAVKNTDYVGIDPNNLSKADPTATSAEFKLTSSNTTLSITSAGCILLVDSSSARTITIPNNSSVAFPVDTEIEIMRYGTGAVTIAAASGVTILCAETARTIAKQYQSVALKKFADNTWVLQGAVG